MDKKDKFLACILLHAVGDTVGYKNGDWEFMPGDIDAKANEKLYEFIYLGGVNGINLEGWDISDDTILHMAIIEGLLTDFSNVNKLGLSLKEIFINSLPTLLEKKDGKVGMKRRPGESTIRSIMRMKDGGNWDDLPYSFSMGGSGAAMRSSCIGLAYYGEKNRGLLTQISIETSRMTHNSVIGYLGGWVAALFTAFAMEDVPIKKWPEKMVNYLLGTEMEKYINTSGRGLKNYMEDVHVFIDKWKRYIDDKFDKDGNIVKRRTTRNVQWRSRYYCNTFSTVYNKINKGDCSTVFVGGAGDDSCIIAYDSLLDSGGNWEMLCVYGMMHGGDTDTTGCIAASWYGVLYGLDRVPKNFLEHLESKDKLMELGESLYKKYA